MSFGIAAYRYRAVHRFIAGRADPNPRVYTYRGKPGTLEEAQAKLDWLLTCPLVLEAWIQASDGRTWRDYPRAEVPAAEAAA